MKARIRRVYNGPLLPYYSKALGRLGARISGDGYEHWAEAEIKSIEDLLQFADETALQVIVGRSFTDKDCMDVCIFDDGLEGRL